jgi:hypothetical protein
VCGGEKRDNEDIVLKSSYFVSTKRFGAHSIVSGYDRFNEKRFVNNHQSGSDFRILGTTTTIVGTTIYPVFQSSTTTRRRAPLSRTTLSAPKARAVISGRIRCT